MKIRVNNFTTRERSIRIAKEAIKQLNEWGVSHYTYFNDAYETKQGLTRRIKLCLNRRLYNNEQLIELQNKMAKLEWFGYNVMLLPNGYQGGWYSRMGIEQTQGPRKASDRTEHTHLIIKITKK